MSLKAGFAEADITPPVGTHKIGWLKDIVSDRVLDPLFARAAVFECDGEQAALIQLDTLSIRWTYVHEIRQRVSRKFGFPGDRLLIAATHNHAGPAVAQTGEVKRDEAYVAVLLDRCVDVFGRAWEGRRESEAGFGHRCEPNLAHNRRVVMRDGTVRTHNSFADPNALCLEGPIDSDVSVLAVRDRQKNVLGCLVNFACHPIDYGGCATLTSGYPGVLARVMKTRGCPVTLFMNGACGNIAAQNPYESGSASSMDIIGTTLADHATLILSGMDWRTKLRLDAATAALQLPYRAITDAEIKGTVRGAQRFMDPAIYDRGMAALCERIRTRKTNPAEVQVLFMDEYAWVGIPAEYFVEHGLRIKQDCWPARPLIVGHANGMLGYVPTRQAFQRGGYETTFAASSRMAPETGDLLADAAIELIRKRMK